MRSYNPAEIVEVMQVTKELIEEVKRKDKKLSTTLKDDLDIMQTLVYEDGLVLREASRQKTDRFTSEQFIDIYLKENDILIVTPNGYKVNLLPIKVLTQKQERLIEKYNELGGKNG